MKDILVVGAGFAGAVVARELADTGRYRVKVIDRRDHIAGNAYDPIDGKTGNRFHQYGPHIFHTNSEEIVNYLSRFTAWLPYQHQVQAYVDAVGCLPLPLNMDSLEMLFGCELHSEAEMRRFLAQRSSPIEKPANAEEYLLSNFGEEITELFFSRYTRKMWDLSLQQLPVSVVSRLPIRFDRSPNYFNDDFQMMPADGYLALFERMLDHNNIEVGLNVEFEQQMERHYDHVFNSMAIDAYFDECFGPLPYRSIIFEHSYSSLIEHAVPTVNFTDNGRYTRQTKWSLYPGCDLGVASSFTREAPCCYTENNLERYYPVKTVDGWPQRRYKQYQELAAKQSHITFIGRCGQYIYYDMHQVVANSLNVVRNYLGK